MSDQPKLQEHQNSLKPMEKYYLTNCGICLLEEGRSIRGQIDCCDHYFCFVCIMEWAKIESTCPLCKRRFTNILQTQKEGLVPCERIVNVPKRDQVYHHFGNATVGPFDPYAHVKCSVCQGTNDDSLLLLCDLCDLAAHTYCVGLGATVPDGDWFCHDCAILRAEHSNAEIDTDADNKNLSIFDVIHEDTDEMRIWKPHLMASLALVVNSGAGINVANEVTLLDRGTYQNNADQPPKLDVRTLHLSQDVQSQIQALRENWNALRNGSLSFASSLGQPHSSTSQGCQLLRARDGLSQGIEHNNYGSSHDIDKAWKKMKIAKSKQQNCGRASSVHLASKSKHPSIKGKAPEQATSTSSSLHIVNRKQPGDSVLGISAFEKKRRYNSPESKTANHRFPKSESQKPNQFMTLKPCEGRSTTQSIRLSESSSSRKAETQCDLRHANRASLSAKCSHEASSSASHEQAGSSYSINLIGSLPTTYDSCNRKPDLHTFSFGEVDNLKGKGRLGKDCARRKEIKDDDAKNEIRSLVKLNLKLLSRDRQLGFDVFKEVARRATHTILAACGLEHPRSNIRIFPSLVVCSHSEHIQQLHKSTLMPNSCRECFHIFVRDVVKAIMFEKCGRGKSC
ncbi:hypothetical protein Patl1_18966 [Pistacia atlantica]|uniref:Uncharacterized protein n=1 Tax=Pistacia atlantica TaxID=434234 RepID=A0ACC1BZ33_9ROSI|nr:hypothetical protein Patl1_18966 [Pistacia atlantica]